MGLTHRRDRLCVVQLSDGNGDAHLVQFAPDQYEAPNLGKLLADVERTKILHFARFDVALILQYMNVVMQPIYCTKIASKLARTYTDRHGYKDICKELLGVDISKQQQSSDWGAAELSQQQVDYAASDVLHLHQLRDKFNAMLEREQRLELALACCHFIPVRAQLDLMGWDEQDIFSHSSK